VKICRRLKGVQPKLKRKRGEVGRATGGNRTAIPVRKSEKGRGFQSAPRRTSVYLKRDRGKTEQEQARKRKIEK